MKKMLTLLALGGALATGAQAGEVYTGIGTHGVMLGYAHPMTPSVTVRGDFATFGSRSTTEREEGIDYDIHLKYNRTGLFADWFFSGGWRLTGGLTSNNVRADMAARGNGATIEIGSRNYTFTAADRFDVKVKYPRTTPYLGFGYGHQPTGTGFGFHFDLGASIGKAKVSAETSGPSFDALTPAERAQLQSDIDRELAELRDGVGKIRAIPQLSLGVSYRF